MLRVLTSDLELSPRRTKTLSLLHSKRSRDYGGTYYHQHQHLSVDVVQGRLETYVLEVKDINLYQVSV